MSQFTLLQPKIAIKVINVDNPKKLIASAYYVKRHVCAYLQPFSWSTSHQWINNHFLEGNPSLTLACTASLILEDLDLDC